MRRLAPLIVYLFPGTSGQYGASCPELENIGDRCGIFENSVWTVRDPCCNELLNNMLAAGCSGRIMGYSIAMYDIIR
jgi:hypothetical protein